MLEVRGEAGRPSQNFHRAHQASGHYAAQRRRPSHNDDGHILIHASYFTSEIDLPSKRSIDVQIASKSSLSVTVKSRIAPRGTYSDTVLARLPAKFFEIFAHITTLRLGCGLERLPPQIAQLSNLRVLDLRGNNLESVPSQVGTMNLLQLIVDTQVTPSYTKLMLTDFVCKIPRNEYDDKDDDNSGESDEDIDKVERDPVSPSLAWLGGPPSLKETILRVILKFVSLSEMDDIVSKKSMLSYVPSHLQPRLLPPDLCGYCQKPVIQMLDENTRFKPPRRYREMVIALQKVVVEYVFCSRRCMIATDREWRDNDIERQIKILQRGLRFMSVDHTPTATAV
ncbi:hypothetical protein V1512DRAFT_133762 [Lipomyces arxii]|uniref:uncharacterized protein n=1 Tax=Lipomyces arxii TaxID=56418 RepID=UPI0034CFC9FA